MRTRRGTAIGAMLAIVSIALLAAFTMAATSSLNLQVTQRQENSQIASMLAESVVNQATAHLMGLSNWTGTIQIDGPVPGSTGRLVCVAGNAFPPGEIVSRNNQTGGSDNGWPQSKLLSGGRVPGERAHLVGVGKCRGVTRIVEALVFVPDFTVAVASTGRVRMRNSVVASVRSPADVARLATNPELLGPGDLATNHAGVTPQAIELSDNSYVSGNVQAVGAVSISADSRFGGEVRDHWRPAEIPRFLVSDYDPARQVTPDGHSALAYREVPNTMGTESMVGINRTTGSAVVNGDLILDNAIYYVDGNLTVRGGMRGTGAVLVDGTTRIEGGVNLTSDDQVALLSQGDVALDGAVANTYSFQGLIYTEGNFSAHNFTVVGAFIANGQHSGRGGVDLLDSNVYYTDVNSQIPFYFPRQLVIQIASAPNPPGRITYAVEHLEEGESAPGDSVTNPIGRIDEEDIQLGCFPGAIWRPDGNYLPGWHGEIWGPFPSVTPAQAKLHVNGGSMFPAHNEEDTPWQWYDIVLLEVTQEKVPGTNIEDFVYYISWNDPGGSYKERYTNPADVINRMVALSVANCPAYNDGENANGPQIMETPAWKRDVGYPQLFRDWAFEDPTDPTFRGVNINFSIDPNRFLKQQDRVRVCAWLRYGD